VVQKSGMKDLIIKTLEILTFIFFIIIVLACVIFYRNVYGGNMFIGFIGGIVAATISCGIIILAIQNNELLKEIRDGDNHSRRLAKLDNDLLKEIKDNLKK